MHVHAFRSPEQKMGKRDRSAIAGARHASAATSGNRSRAEGMGKRERAPKARRVRCTSPYSQLQ